MQPVALPGPSPLLPLCGVQRSLSAQTLWTEIISCSPVISQYFSPVKSREKCAPPSLLAHNDDLGEGAGLRPSFHSTDKHTDSLLPVQCEPYVCLF